MQDCNDDDKGAKNSSSLQFAMGSSSGEAGGPPPKFSLAALIQQKAQESLRNLNPTNTTKAAFKDKPDKTQSTTKTLNAAATKRKKVATNKAVHQQSSSTQKLPQITLKPEPKLSVDHGLQFGAPPITGSAANKHEGSDKSDRLRGIEDPELEDVSNDIGKQGSRQLFEGNTSPSAGLHIPSYKPHHDNEEFNLSDVDSDQRNELLELERQIEMDDLTRGERRRLQNKRNVLKAKIKKDIETENHKSKISRLQKKILHQNRIIQQDHQYKLQRDALREENKMLKKKIVGLLDKSKDLRKQRQHYYDMAATLKKKLSSKSSTFSVNQGKKVKVYKIVPTPDHLKPQLEKLSSQITNKQISLNQQSNSGQTSQQPQQQQQPAPQQQQPPQQPQMHQQQMPMQQQPISQQQQQPVHQMPQQQQQMPQTQQQPMQQMPPQHPSQQMPHQPQQHSMQQMQQPMPQQQQPVFQQQPMPEFSGQQQQSPVIIQQQVQGSQHPMTTSYQPRLGPKAQMSNSPTFQQVHSQGPIQMEVKQSDHYYHHQQKAVMFRGVPGGGNGQFGPQYQPQQQQFQQQHPSHQTVQYQQPQPQFQFQAASPSMMPPQQATSPGLPQQKLSQGFHFDYQPFPGGPPSSYNSGNVAAYNNARGRSESNQFAGTPTTGFTKQVFYAPTNQPPQQQNPSIQHSRGPSPPNGSAALEHKQQEASVPQEQSGERQKQSE